MPSGLSFGCANLHFTSNRRFGPPGITNSVDRGASHRRRQTLDSLHNPFHSTVKGGHTALHRSRDGLHLVMAPATPSSSDDSHQHLLDQLDITAVPKGFRNPTWKPPVRRNKNINQIITDASRKEASLLATQNNSGASTPMPAGSQQATGGMSTPARPANGASSQPNIAQAAQNLSTLVLEKNLQSSFSSGPQATYSNVESAPSLHPAHRKHYCDITGLAAPYTDPKTRLRYHNQEVFQVVRSLGQGVAENYLEARGAHVVLK